MDPTKQPLTPQPQVPQSPDEPSIPTEGHSKTPLLLVGGIFFILLLVGMMYYIMQPVGTTTQDSAYQTPAAASPTSAEVAQTAEEQDVEAAVSYSLDDSFAELEKDLSEL